MSVSEMRLRDAFIIEKGLIEILAIVHKISISEIQTASNVKFDILLADETGTIVLREFRKEAEQLTINKLTTGQICIFKMKVGVWNRELHGIIVDVFTADDEDVQLRGAELKAWYNEIYMTFNPEDISITYPHIVDICSLEKGPRIPYLKGVILTKIVQGNRLTLTIGDATGKLNITSWDQQNFSGEKEQMIFVRNVRISEYNNNIQYTMDQLSEYVVHDSVHHRYTPSSSEETPETPVRRKLFESHSSETSSNKSSTAESSASRRSSSYPVNIVSPVVELVQDLQNHYMKSEKKGTLIRSIFDIIGCDDFAFPLTLNYLREFVKNNENKEEVKQIEDDLMKIAKSLPCNFTLPDTFFNEITNILDSRPQSKRTRQIKRKLFALIDSDSEDDI